MTEEQYILIGKVIEWSLKENGYVDIYSFGDLDDLIEQYNEIKRS